MVHDTLALRSELRKWLPIFKAALGLSQNGFAREAGVDESIFSRWLRGAITSGPCEDASRRALTRLQKRVMVAREKVG